MPRHVAPRPSAPEPFAPAPCCCGRGFTPGATRSQAAAPDTPYAAQDARQDALCAALLRDLGGAGNIVRLNHCTTRLRIRVAVGTKVDVAALKSHHEVFNVIVQGSEFQLVINGAVDELC